MHEFGVLQNVIVHLLGGTRIACVAPIRIGGSCDPDVVVHIILIHRSEIGRVGRIDQIRTGRQSHSIRIIDATAEDRSGHVVSMISRACSRAVVQDPPGVVDVGTDIAIVSMANDRSAAVVVQSCGGLHLVQAAHCSAFEVLRRSFLIEFFEEHYGWMSQQSADFTRMDPEGVCVGT